MAKLTQPVGESVEKPADMIIEKYLANREDIAPEMKRVMSILYKGQIHTAAQWDDIVTKRLTRPAY